MEVVKEVVVAAALLVTLAAPAWAGLREGWAAYDRGDYATAMQGLRPVAEQGDAYVASVPDDSHLYRMQPARWRTVDYRKLGGV